ncbi:Uncharacterised protein [Providencia rustigianii]|nr:Uncharacterised protein [Providencia rustigianii]
MFGVLDRYIWSNYPQFDFNGAIFAGFFVRDHQVC